MTALDDVAEVSNVVPLCKILLQMHAGEPTAILRLKNASFCAAEDSSCAREYSLLLLPELGMLPVERETYSASSTIASTMLLCGSYVIQRAK